MFPMDADDWAVAAVTAEAELERDRLFRLSTLNRSRGADRGVESAEGIANPVSVRHVSVHTQKLVADHGEEVRADRIGVDQAAARDEPVVIGAITAKVAYLRDRACAGVAGVHGLSNRVVRLVHWGCEGDA